MTAEEHRKFLETDFSDVKLEELNDIGKIRIDIKKKIKKKKRQQLKQVGNPYLVRVGDTMVKIRFANSGVSFEEAFENLLLMAQGFFCERSQRNNKNKKVVENLLDMCYDMIQGKGSLRRNSEKGPLQYGLNTSVLPGFVPT